VSVSKMGACVVLLAAGLSSRAAAAEAEGTWAALVAPDNSTSLWVIKGDAPVLAVGVFGWGPNWGSFAGATAKAKATGEELDVTAPLALSPKKGDVVTVRCRAQKSGDQSVTYRYELSAERDYPITMIIAGIATAGESASGEIIATLADGKERTIPIPIPRAGESTPASKITFKLKDVGDVAVVLDPPCPLHIEHNNLRVMLAKDLLKKGSSTVQMTVTAPSRMAFLARPEEGERFVRTLAGPDWFPFTPQNDTGPGVINFNDWLDRPAGRRGGVRMVRDRFQFEDGTPVRFWGVNLSYGGGCAPEPRNAAITAARYARYGVNAVRLHKFTYPKNHGGIGTLNDATQMEPEGLERLDNFAAQLIQQGVYFGWSHTFGFHVCPGNRDRLLAYDEIAGGLQGNTYALINFAEDVQDLMIEMVVNLLRHKNPHTDRTYAEEPALCFIELQNEDDIFFYTTTKALDSCPTYKKRLTERFADWLDKKYGSQVKLAEAWGNALKGGENLDEKNIALQGNPWFFGQDHLPNVGPKERVRLLDNAAFFHDVQNKFYSRFAKAIRDTGYKGPLCGSPWQAPPMVPHYYNLRSDYLVGYIDRHAYFGGKPPDTMLTRPGSGYFSTGLEQVIDRPFGLSEWIHVYPSLYSAEGPAILAAYGFGLQGWDASYEFQSSSNRKGFAEIAGWFPWGVWEADVPTQLGQYPTLARMIHRGDVKEGEIISVRRLSLGELAEGKFAFSDRVTQSGDIRSVTSTVPPEALAAGRVLVEFTDKPEPSTFPDMAKYRKDSPPLAPTLPRGGDKSDAPASSSSVIVSTTGQLAWDTSGKGFFTVNTDGTKAVVGFAEGKEIALGNVTIQLQCPYASIFLTALEKDATLANAKSALISAVARNCNTGFKTLTLDNRVLENGKGPILLEPVKARITISGRPITAVYVLDHDGRRTDRTVPLLNDSFILDGARDKAIYYEVQFR